MNKRISAFPIKGCRNLRVPDRLTADVRLAISQLPSNPKNDYLKRECFSKFVSHDTDPAIVRRQRAINKWLATEADNQATNVRLLTLDEEYNILPRVSWSHFRDFTRSVIKDILGDTPHWELEPGFLGSFSGGATTSRKRTSSHPAEKYLGKADITPRALEAVLEILQESPIWGETLLVSDLSIVRGNVLFTVPKNTEIDRCACKEPDLNMYLQRGFGDQIRLALRRVGINLNDQSRNRALAELGSRTGSLATLDLSSASDSISYELVAQLLPEVWFTSLDSCRSPVTMIDGEVHDNEMFSSMGNGFTFELESLLFYSIAKAVCYFRGVSGVVSVYGDDIIVPVDASSYLTSVLEMLGFSVNTKKSFAEGPFRESCGGHYYNGCDITPFYIKAPIERLTDVIRVCNQIRKWSRNSTSILDDDLETLWRHLAAYVPDELWGGQDLTSIYQLVAPTRSKRPKKLSPRRRSRLLPELGRYLFWLDTARRRGPNGDCITIGLTETLSRFRFSRAEGARVLEHSFLHEVWSDVPE
nr:MAG: RNA replicase beta chain [Sanya fiers-like virus 27]